MRKHQATGESGVLEIGSAQPVALHFEGGYSLLELIITMAVFAIFAMATIPLAQNSITHQREMELRESLREIRMAIDEFKRDTIGACPQGANPIDNRPAPGAGGARPGVPAVPADPRSRVVIDDCKIFDNENLDRYPPTLETLVEGVLVKARGFPGQSGGSVFNQGTEVLDDNKKELKKSYLREIPVDPFTGEKDWKLRSSYQEKDAESWDEVNVFDVHSASEKEALNGEKYSDW